MGCVKVEVVWDPTKPWSGMTSPDPCLFLFQQVPRDPLLAGPSGCFRIRRRSCYRMFFNALKDNWKKVYGALSFGFKV